MLVWVAILLHSSCVFFFPWKTLLASVFSTAARYLLNNISTTTQHKFLLSRFIDLTSIASWQLGRSFKPNFCFLYLLDTFSTDFDPLRFLGSFSIDYWHISWSIKVILCAIYQLDSILICRDPFAWIVFHMFCIFLLSCYP